VGAAEDFAGFYRRTRDVCLRAVIAAGADPSTAEEAVAEAFARAYARWASVSRHPAPQAWVVLTAIRYHRSWWRSRRRETLVPTVGESASLTEPGLVLDRELMTALGELSPRQRQVVALRVLLDLDAATTAEVLGLSVNTVGVHLHRALATLRDRVGTVNEMEGGGR
jgi:RNA polymerase sigma-70 factor (ECF subfamily)